MSLFSLPRTSGAAVLPVATAAVWVLAAAGAVYWVLHWPSTQMANTVSLAESTAVRTDLQTQRQAAMARALGQAASPSANPALQASTTHQLLGVIASASGQGSALIATDGQPPKAYRVGQTVQDGWTLVSLTARQARLQSSGAEVLLELPPSDPAPSNTP